MNDQAETSPTDDRVAVLASSRRRLALYHIHDCNGEIGFEELSRRIAAAEADLPTGDVEEALVTRVSETLYLTHLPVLIEHGVVEYEDDVVYATDRLDELVDLLQDPQDQRRRWSLYYAAPAAVLSVAVVVLDSVFAGASAAALSAVALIGAAILLFVSLAKHVDGPSLLSSR